MNTSAIAILADAVAKLIDRDRRLDALVTIDHGSVTAQAARVTEEVLKTKLGGKRTTDVMKIATSPS